MEKREPKIIDAARVRPFVVDETYSSKMLLDDGLAGARTIQINEGTVAPGCALGGAAHGQDEIYYIVSGRGTLRLGEETHPIKPGTVVYIPAGCFHALNNSDGGEPLVLLTLWREPEENEVYNQRIAAWGTSFQLIDE
jgi:mannose-6-phosphate isomerase-like protein (cupin superfamily)